MGRRPYGLSTPQLRKHRLIEVTWVDSGGETQIWDFKDDFVFAPDVIKTVGYNLGHHDGYLYVCQSINHHQYGRKFRIPKRAIKSVRKL